MSHSVPFFSIVVPSHNRPAALRKAIGSFLDLDYPRDQFEVIIVHDCPESEIREDLVAQFGKQVSLCEIFQPHAGPAAARNAGARHAHGEYLAFTDDDCLVAPGWLRAMADHLASNPTSACAGRTINRVARSPYADAAQMINDFVISASAEMKAPFFTSNNLVIPTKIFSSIGGFHTAFPGAAGEDREFSLRWQSRGYRLDHVPAAIVYHAHDLDSFTFIRQQFTYGRAAHQLRELLEQSTKERVGLESGRFYLDLIRHPFRSGLSRRSLRLAALLVLSQLAVALGFATAVLSNVRALRQLAGVPVSQPLNLAEEC